MTIAAFLLSTLLLAVQSEKETDRRRLGYTSRMSGSCGSGKIISTSAGCEAAAKMYGAEDTDVHSENSGSYPPGCYIWKSGVSTFHLTWNQRLSSTAACSSTRSCLCTDSSLQMPMYLQRTSETCEGSIESTRLTSKTITSPEACRRGAKSSMVSWTDSTVSTTSNSDYPKGCYLYRAWNGDTLYYNSFSGTSSVPYSNDRKGLCELTCKSGYYQNQNLQTDCKACPVNSFSDTFGSGNCATCPSGWSTSGVGSSACTDDCVGTGQYIDPEKAGYFVANNAACSLPYVRLTSFDMCKQAAQQFYGSNYNFFSLARSNTPKGCGFSGRDIHFNTNDDSVASNYPANWGTTRGSYCKQQTKCSICAAGQYVNSQRTSCTCNTGYTLNNGACALTCDDANCDTCSDAATCTTCKTGFGTCIQQRSVFFFGGDIVSSF